MTTVLDSIHVLIVDPYEEDRRKAQQVLSTSQAVVHAVERWDEAFSALFSMYEQNLIPRVLIIEWFMQIPGSPQYEFNRRRGAPELNTSASLIRGTMAYDKTIDIIVYTQCPDEITDEIRSMPLRQIVDKNSGIDSLIDLLVDCHVMA
jgi:CheY-like chemotaxis protein